MMEMVKDRSWQLVSISLLIVILSVSFVIAPPGTDGQDTVSDIQLNQMTLHLSEGMELDPLDQPATDEYQAISIPNGFIRSGFRGLGIIPIGSTEWKPVGSWYTQPLKQPINLGGFVEVIAYAYKEETDGTSPNSQFKFEILKGSEVLLELNLGGTAIREGTDVILKATGSFPPGNDTTIESGTSMVFRVSAKSNGGGATLRFGTERYDSHFTFSSNSLEIRNLYMTKKEVILEYKDAFMAPWTRLYSALEIERVKIPQDDMSSMMNSLNYTREIHWERSSSPGKYEVFASLGYSMDENLSSQKSLEITEKKESWFKLENVKNTVSGNIPLLIIIVIAIAVISIYMRRRSRQWKRRFSRLPPDIQDKKDKKSAWKDLDKERKKRLKEKRLERVIDDDEEPDEDEMENKDFNLFKRSVIGGSDGFQAEEIEELEL